jgi:hypothetical protein
LDFVFPLSLLFGFKTSSHDIHLSQSSTLTISNAPGHCVDVDLGMIIHCLKNQWVWQMGALDFW